MSPSLRLDDEGLFARAVSALVEFAARRVLRTQNFGVAMAVLIHRNAPRSKASGPSTLLFSPGTGEPISTGHLEAICDQTYAKDAAFLPRSAEGPVFKPFTPHFKPPSPRINNWRNSFDLQAGLGCDAPYDDDFLLSPDYLAEDRFHCMFRDPRTGRCDSPAGIRTAARTCFNPNKRGTPPGPTSRALKCPKLLARGIDSAGNEGYWFIEPTANVLAQFLADPKERVPVYPFLVALYGGSTYFGTWGSTAGPERLQSDLRLDPERFDVLFDPDPSHPINAAILRAAGGRGPTAVTVPGRAPARVPAPARALPSPRPFRFGRNPKEFRRTASKESDPERRRQLLEKANRTHLQTVQALAKEFADAGLNPADQERGYDLYVAHAGEGHLFEIKTWTLINLVGQVRYALGQLYQYRWLNRTILPGTVRLNIVFDRQPPESPFAELWEFLADDREVTPCWMEGGRLRTFPKYSARLAWIP